MPEKFAFPACGGLTLRGLRGFACGRRAAAFTAARFLIIKKGLNLIVTASSLAKFFCRRRWLSPLAGALGLALLPLSGTLLLAPTPTASAQEPQGFDTVIIDAGHGGHDRGGVPGQRGVAEKEVTLDTALRLQRILRAQGLHTVLTRDGDYFVPLGQRTAYTAGRGNAVFLSIHFNSAPREGASGIETYYYRGDSFGLAERLHESIIAATGADNRALRRRGFYVIRNSHIPAVLCECGFLTNYEEEVRIANSGSYRQKLAEAMARALIAQRSSGDPNGLGSQPPVTSERLVSRGHRGGGRHGRGGRRYYYVSRHSRGGGRSRHGHAISSRHHGGSSRSSRHASTSSHRRRRRG